MTWAKGQSGNPKGAAPDPLRQHVRDMARECTEEAITALRNVANMAKDAAMVHELDPKALGPIVHAAEALLNRGWGRPAEMSDDDVRKMSDDELRAKVVALVRKTG